MRTISKKNKIAAAIFLALGLLSLALGVMLWGAPAAVQAAETEHDQTHSGWTELTEGDGILRNGNYYLTGDLDLTADFSFDPNHTVTLCLNGHKLTGTGSNSVIIVSAGANFTLCDCNGSNQTHYYTVDETTGRYKFDGVTADTPGAQSVVGGVITGGSSNYEGGGVSVNHGTFTMLGGTIAGNSARDGGGVSVNVNSTFTMSGGTIAGNSATTNGATTNGGGVCVKGNSTFTMSGGTISDNKATGSGNGNGFGGGVCVNGNSTFTMNDGTISANSASEMGGGVYVGGTFTMSDGTISANSASERGGGVFVTGSKATFIMSGGYLGDAIEKSSSGNISIEGGYLSDEVDKSYVADGYTVVEITADSGDENYKEGFPNAVKHEHDGEIFTKLTEGDGTTLSSGNYYLSGDLNADLTVSGAVTLCLNGHILKGTGGGSVIIVSAGAEFTLCDCNSSKSTHYYTVDETTGRYNFVGVTADTPDAQPVVGGVITGGNATEGGGVYMDGGTFTMEGGTIAGNSATTNGGGVFVCGNSTTFTMEGGTIAGNSATEGSGVFVTGTNSAFTMSGGYLSDAINRSISGNISISGGYFEKDPQAYLADGYTVVEITADSGDENYKEGFPYAVKPEHEHDGKIFIKLTAAGGALSGGNYYLSDDLNADLTVSGAVTLCLNGYVLTGSGGGSVITVSDGAEFTLCDCSTDASNTIGEVTYTTGVITGGNATNGGGVYVSSGGNFEMTGGTIAGNSATSYGGGVYVSSGGTFTMSGGAIAGNSATVGGGVYVDGGTFTMEGGTIAANTASTNGGGVYVYGTFKMQSVEGTAAPTISGNKAGSGGGVFVYGNSTTFTMEGGIISGNTATSDGGGVFVNGNGTFTMSGTAAITGNVVTYGYGGGVYVASGTFKMSETAKISANSAGFGGGVYVKGGSFEMSGGTISGHKVTSGGGVSVSNNSTFTMTGGTIGGAENDANTATGAGGGVYVYGGTFNMSGTATISGNSAASGGGVYVDGNIGTFTMQAAEGSTAAPTISGNSAVSGGGVYFNGTYATFTMSDGTITGNSVTGADAFGGGVYVASGTFTMSGGTIGGSEEGAGNSATSGGGVYFSGTTFTMTGGTIGSNTATSNGGGVYVASGTFEMNAATDDSTAPTISGNSATTNGGGVYVGGGTFTMSGGTIGGNKVTGTYSYGGGVYVNGGTFTMQAAEGSTAAPTISGNKAASSGGGVHVSSGTFTMSGGTIGGSADDANTAIFGGGVYVNSGITFTMTGGIISNNTATKYDGGVYVSVRGIFNMSGGEISNNTATSYGGGVYINFNDIDFELGIINLSGSPTITDNTTNGAANNLYLVSYIVINSNSGTNNLTVGASIGITLANNYGDYPFAYTASTNDAAQYFSSDAGGVVELDSAAANGYKLYYKEKVTVSGGPSDLTGVFSGLATDSDGSYYFKLYHGNEKGSFTVTPPTGYELSSVTIFGNTATASSGSYTVSYTNYLAATTDKSIVVEFENKQINSIKWYYSQGDGTTEITAGTALTYNGKEYTITATGYTDDGDSVTLTVTVSGGGSVLNADTYTLTASLLEDSSYRFGENLSTTKEITISKATPTVNANDITVIYTGSAVAASQISGAATFNGTAVFGAWSWKNDAPTTIANSGEHIVVFTPTGSNFNTVETTITVTINKAQSSVTITTSTLDKTYDGTAVFAPVYATTGDGNVTVTWYSVEGETATQLSEAPVNAGDYKVVVTISESTNYTAASAEKTFTISKANITAGVTLNGWTYGDTANNPVGSGNSGGGTVTYKYESTDGAGYNSSEKPTEAGSYKLTITIAATANYNGGTAEVTFTISPKALAESMVSGIDTTYTYTGSAITPAVTVKDGDTTLTLDTDFTVSYANNTNAGTATVTIVGKGNYSGTVTKTFTISKAQLTVSVSGTISKEYDGTTTVESGDIALTLATPVSNDDVSIATGWTAEYASANVGTGITVTISNLSLTGDDAGNYELSATTTTTGAITAKAISGEGSDPATGFEISGIDTTYTYTGSAIQPTPAVADGEMALVLGTDYTVAYGDNITVSGGGSVTISGKGNYTGTVKLTFTIAQAEGTSAPDYTEPQGLSICVGHTLEDVALPTGWTWKDETSSVGDTEMEENTFTAVFTPSDKNYKTAEVKLTVTVTEHTESEVVYENEVAATCTEDGSYDEVVYCSVCKAEISREGMTIPAKGHTPQTIPGKAATCTQTGLTSGSRCSVCGTVLQLQSVIPAAGHTPGKEATCTEAQLCTVCGETLAEAKGHTAGAPVRENEKAPTCTEEGSYDEVVYCTVCEEELSRKTVTVGAAGHSPAIVEGKDATCTESGLTDGEKCSVCGETLQKQEEIPALGHNFGEWSVTEEAGIGREGEEQRTCSRCGEKETRVIPAEEFPLWLILLIVLICILLVGGAVVLIIVLKKKKQA